MFHSYRNQSVNFDGKLTGFYVSQTMTLKKVPIGNAMPTVFRSGPDIEENMKVVHQYIISISEPILDIEGMVALFAAQFLKKGRFICLHLVKRYLL